MPPTYPSSRSLSRSRSPSPSDSGSVPAASGSAIFRPLSTPALFSALASSSTLASASVSTPPPSSATFSPPPPAAAHRLPPPSRRRRTPLLEPDPLDVFDLPSRDQADLGDDDSFSPHIVSGYHFPVPLARDGEHFGPSVPNPQRVHNFVEEPDIDHRVEAVYDDLDDIGDWVANTAPQQDLTKKLARAVARSSARPAAAGVAAANAALSVHQRTEDRRRENVARDKLDRATVEQVLDPRTRMILFRLLSRNRLRTLDGCVSTGKEANVYFATAAANPHLSPDADGTYRPNPDLRADDMAPDAAVAVKVFKTSILQFKDRERYVAGEFRFRRGGYQRGSNRKMVQQWAEKEFRNQIRLQEAGIPAPVPLLLKPPVLIMSFFGKDGWPAPRLKDASLSVSKLKKAYFRVCVLMRRMFRVAHLVHGDLSEYNMLYWKGEIVIIDVSQSVEDDHPMALDFLRRDCANVNDFFRRHCGGPVLSVRELFDFVTGEHIGDEEHEQESALGFLLEAASARDTNSTKLVQQDDEVFMRSYIPRTLQEVELREQQFRAESSIDLEHNLFAKITGLTVTQKRERVVASSPKSPSISEGSSSRVGPVDAEARRSLLSLPVDGDFEDGDMVNLEAPLSEPATVRTLPAKDKTRIRSSSPVTSSSSLRPQGEERGTRRLSKILEQQARIDAVSGIADESTVTQIVTRVDENELFEDNEGTDSSSGDVWIRKAREEGSDPYMGLTKKEWKKKVKAEARDKRENKIPKHVKKRKETLAKRRRGNK